MQTGLVHTNLGSNIECKHVRNICHEPSPLSSGKGMAGSEESCHYTAAVVNALGKRL